VDFKEKAVKKLVEKVALLLAGGAIALSVYVLAMPKLAHAAQQQYKVIQIFADPSALESMLNKEATQGWVYAGSFGLLIILRK
jgi:hypothetical protein